MKRLRLILTLATLPLLPAMLAGCGSRGVAATGGQPSALATKTLGPTSPPEPPVAVSPPVSDEVKAPAPSAAPVENPPAPASPKKPPAGKAMDKTFDDVKFEMQPDEPFRREMIGEKIEGLAGQRIRIRGYILPTAQQRGIKQFVLVRDNQQCCFGPGAALYDCILVEMQPGRTAEFSIRPVAVEGTFNVDIMPGPDDKPLAIYHLVGESVR